MEHEMFITMFTTACVLILSSARSIHSTPNFTSCISILTLYSHLRLDLSSEFLPQCSDENSVGTFPFPLFLTHFNVNLILYFITRNICWGVRLWNSCLFNPLLPSVSSSPLVPYVSLSAVLSNILSLRPSLSVEDQVSPRIKQQAKVYFSIFPRSLVINSSEFQRRYFMFCSYFFMCFFFHSFLLLLFGTYF